MPKEIKCPECGKKMRSKRYHQEFEFYKGNKKKTSKGEREYKYICHNDRCPNYKQEFDCWELEDSA